jgi:flagellar biosynthetic protein FlhB
VAEEKTEQPTAKKLKDARKKGQVSKSNDLTGALLLLAALGVLSMGGAAYVSELEKLMVDSFRASSLTGLLRQDEIVHRFGYAWARMFLLLAPLLGVLFAVSGSIGFLQVQGLFAPQAIKPKFDKLNPLKGFQNIFFKARTYLELVKNLAKFAIVTALAYFVIRHSLRDIVLSARADPPILAQLATTLMFSLLFKVGGVFLFLGALDFMLQKKLYIKGLKMSKYEVQKEFKEEEGDPHVKHMRKHLHHQLLAQGMIESVPKADVVVVNPTHIAIALQYDERSMNAPTVTAKGQELVADKIKELAKKHHIPIVRNVSLAHGLYELEVGREISEELYETVAEVLNWVYQLRQAEE